MSRTRALRTSELLDQYVIRIQAHLVRLGQGHDPMGHLFGIERLARGARAELAETHRRLEHGQPSR